MYVCRRSFSIRRGRSEYSMQLVCAHSCTFACNPTLRNRSMDSAWGHTAALHDNVPHNVFQPQSHGSIQVSVCICASPVRQCWRACSLLSCRSQMLRLVMCRYYLSCDANPAFCGQSIAAQVRGTACERVARKQCNE
jgi:hypothetical protein